jgi:hypothetical protein
MKMKHFKMLGTIATLVLSASFAFGQATSGAIVGTVKDATGAVIPNATVTAVNAATGVSTTAKSGRAGDYSLENLLPGNYNVTFTASGFGAYKLSGLEIDLGKTSTEDVNLIVSSNSSVEVEAFAGVTLDTTSNNLTTNLTSEELSILPTASVGNGVLNASLLAPNVASGGGAGIGTGPSVGGQRPRNNNYTIEGVDDNDKSVTGPLVEIPNDAVADFTLITSQFSPEFGHSSGGQFNTTVISGTNHFHGKAYEYFENRNLNAENGTAGGKNPNTRFDRNRYGGQLGGPIFKDKLFFFANYERTTVGQSQNIFDCTPTATGVALLNSNAAALGFNATNLAQYLLYTPAATTGAAPVDAKVDEACFDEQSGGQFLTAGNAAYVYSQNPSLTPPPGLAPAASVNIPLGNAHLTPSVFSNTSTATASIDFTPTPKDQFRFRYNYLTSSSVDTVASIPQFQTTNPFVTHFEAFSWFHDFTPNLINEARIGFNREFSPDVVGPQQFPGLNAFPNLIFFDADIDVGPDDNAPQSTIQNFYQFVDNVSYVKGKHTFKFGFDGRKYIAPTNFIQRQRGDYEWYEVTAYLDDLAPDYFGERSSGAANYYGDQTAFYGYGNDTWRVTDKLTFNYGLRYEFTSVPVGERRQSQNAISNTPGLITFAAPQPGYKNFAPRVGIAYALDEKTSIRAGFGIAYDVLFDNLGTLSAPPQFSQTHDVGNTANGDPNYLQAGFLSVNKGLSSTLTPITTAAIGRADTAAFLPNQVLPYSENYNLTIQRVFAKNYTAEIQYLGTRGVHLPVQNQLNVTPPVTAANQLTTYLSGPVLTTDPVSGITYGQINTSATANTLGAIQNSVGAAGYITPAFYNAGYFSKITSYQPYGGSNYNGLGLNVTRRFINGFQMNGSYTWSKALDDSTAEVNASELTQRRPQNSRNQHAEYARSALDRNQRFTLEAVYDLPYFKHSSFLLKNLAGNWEVSPIYTYETPEYVTPSSEVNSNLNGDSGGISRTFFNTAGNKQVGSGVYTVYSTNPTLVALCGAGVTQCNADTVGYVAQNPNAGYITSGPGTIPNAERNTLAGRPIDNVDISALKRISFGDRYSFEFIAQAFNLLNHSQFVPGSLNDITGTSTAGIATAYLDPSKGSLFNNPTKEYTANARTMQLVAKFNF